MYRIGNTGSEKATVIDHLLLNVALPNVAAGLQSVATEGLVVHLVCSVLQILEIAPEDTQDEDQHAISTKNHV